VSNTDDALLLPFLENDDEDKSTTLGSLLVDWLPDLFHKMADESVVEPKSEAYRWFVGGINPPLTIGIVELWQNLCHPDHFLYIVVLTR
jgi:hypothetical protein